MPTAEMEAVESVSRTGEAVASLENVTKNYGSVTALDGLSLKLYPGEIVALLGANGAGKSTAVRLLLGLSAPTTGTVTIFGRDPRLAATRTRIGAMLQVASMPKTLKVKEHIDLFRSYYPKPLAVKEIVRIAQLSGIEDRLFEQLSGGQRQRLLFGLALCGDPEVIFLDEPTVGMDIEARRGLWVQVRELAAQGRTVLLTTHYLEEADALASRIVVIDKGRVVSEGTPSEIKSQTASKRIRCRTALSSAQIWTLPGVIDVEQTDGWTCVTAGNAEAVLRKMFAFDEGLSGLEVVSPGLEEAFLSLTTKRV
ncbi:ABC transporter ATP-binding protein [Granulicella tundricola]|uniref:ABC transporter related protein n=1 Tax=Granulicella tundricola (strain ATCC BAA-1859 / DSM 23138 / MP5ACTX9) TaxID=1198114 RepID=E8WWP7_GRATM|nr:ABC transporter ATP-binding protein [Granulicella tundricola]ADW67375.1 ABC transporter related protein [Granulicella tundricola MP5ACTX9]